VALTKSVFKPYVLAAVVAAAATVALAAQQPASSATADQVVYASVLDAQRIPVTTLGAADFVVREGSVEREVTAVSPASDPLRIAVLVDTSQSMEPYMSDVRRALHAYVRQVQTDADIALFEFGERPTRLVDYTRDPSRLEPAIDRLFARSASGAYALDAIVDVSRDFRLREAARPVIIVISGQGPEFSQRYYRTVLDELRASRAILHSLVITRRRLPIVNDGIREREQTFSEGATLTGGTREDLLTSMALEDALTRVARELKSQYRVVYARPAMLIPPARLDITVRQSGLTVRAPRVPFTNRARP
jgi:VWFA-related protein